MSLQLTMIGRVSDGMPLAASVQNEETNMNEFQGQAKVLFRKIKPTSPPEGSLETKNNMIFHYIIRSGVCYLVLCEQNFTKRTAFSYLEDLHSEFFVQYGAKIDVVTRPYAFIEFDSYIQKSKRSYSDARNARAGQLERVSAELQDVQKIMIGNIDDVLQRGMALDELANQSNALNSMSSKYRKQAGTLNQTSTYVKIAAVGGCGFFLFFILRFLIGF